MKKLLLLLGLLAIAPAQAADNALVVTPGSGVTMRTIDVGSLVQAGTSVPVGVNGASAWGTAGTANANILSVQGIASMTPLLATVTGTVNPTTAASWGLGATAAAVPANAAYVGMNQGGNLVGFTGTSGSLNVVCTSGCVGGSGVSQGAVTTAAPTYTTGTNQALSLDTAGNLRVTAVGATGGTSSTFGAAFPGTGTAIGGSDASNTMHSFGLAQLGVAPTAGQWAAITSASAPVAGSFIDGWDATQGAKADTTCGTATGTCSAIALLKFLNTAVTGPVSAGSNLIGVVNTAAATTGGCTPAHYYMAGTSVNSTNVKNAAGTLCELTIINTSTAQGFFRLYDLSAAPTCSSATGAVAAYPIQSNATSPGLTINLGSFGKAFQNGIGFCFTNAVGDTDNTNWAGTTNNVVVNMGYK